MTIWRVEPETGGGTPAGSGTQADPWNGIGNVVFGASGVTHGDILEFVAGDYTGEGTFSVTTTFTSPTEFKALGPVQLDRFLSNGKANVRVTGQFSISNVTQSNFAIFSNVTRTQDGALVQGVHSSLSPTTGIALVPSGAFDPTPAAFCAIRDCFSDTDGQHGVEMRGAFNGGLLSNNKATGSSEDVSGWGVYASAAHEKWVDTGWSLVSGTSYERTISSGWDVKTVVAPGRTSAPYWLSEGTFDALNAGEWAQSGTTLQINTGEDPSSKSVVAVYQECKNIIMEDNEAWSMNAAFDGTGMGGDHTVEGMSIRRNLSRDNPGRGIELNCGKNSDLIGNSTPNNDYGAAVLTPNGTCTIRQHSSYGTGSGQYLIQRVEAGATVLLTNCIGQGGTNVAEGSSISGTVTDSYNCMFGGGTANYSGITKGTGSIEQDPLFVDPANNDLRLDGNSPCIGAGTEWWTDVPQGEDGLRFCAPPSMGAYEVRPHRSGYARGAGALPARVLPAGVDIAKAKSA